jgi:hypothetical protein
MICGILVRMQASMTDHTCKNCGNRFNGKFCNQCGEKVYTDNDRRIGHFLEEGFHFITHFEGTFFTTVKSIFIRPGQLSLDYSEGIRKKYFKPLSFFLLLIVLYLIFPLMNGLNMKLVSYETQAFYGDWVKDKVSQFLTLHPDITMEQLAERFAAKSGKASKILLFFIIPITALPLWLFNYRKRPLFYDHLILSTEFNSMFILVGFFIVPLIIVIASVVFPIPENSMDHVFGIIIYVALVFYLRSGLIRLYRLRPAGIVLLSVVFMVWHIFTVFFLYKFILFCVVFFQLH